MKTFFKKISIVGAALLLMVQAPSLARAEGEKKADSMDWGEEIIYSIITDRFNDGDPSNNDPYNNGSYDKNHLEAYHGGDFQGIIDKVPYLKDLGVTTIWISPIVKNIATNMREAEGDKQYGYHGYWAEDFTQLDPHLGDEAKLKELIDLLHDNGIKLMVDVVLNHAGYGTKEAPQFKDMFRTDPDRTLTRQELSGLPDFKTEEPAVREKLIKWQTDWLEKLRTEKGNSIDYFRVDTVKHVEYETWQAFKSKLTSIDPNFKLMGEFFDGAVNNHGGYLDKTMMDSILDFDFKNLAKRYVNGKFEDAEIELEYRNDKITDDMSTSQFLSSHDEDGFLKMKLTDNIPKFKTAATLQLTSKGQPVIYYGEEIGQSGKKDDMANGVYSENRYDFDWTKIKDNSLLEHYKKLIKIRKDYKDIFAKGDRKALFADDKVSVFARNLDGKTAIVAINTDPDAQKVSFKVDGLTGDFGDIYNLKKVSNSKGTIDLSIPGNDLGGTAILVSLDDVKEDYKVRDTMAYLFTFIGLVIAVTALIFALSLRKKKRVDM